MKPVYIILMPFLFLANSLLSQHIIGSWKGALTVQGMQLPLVLHINQNGDSLHSTMDSPLQGAKGIPVDATTFLGNELKFEIKKLTVVYSGQLKGDSISGTFTQSGMNFPLTFKRSAGNTSDDLKRPQTPKPPFNYNIEEISFVNASEGNTLAGTLTTPKNKKQFPVVVMITGSGLQDRDETLFEHKPFWVIADHFTNNGIGVLRLDDRGIGGSSKGKDGTTSADFATDINAAVEWLKQRGYKNIGLVGHSEGGMIAPMVAVKNKDVNFIVSMAGPGIAIDKLMALQVYAVGKSGGESETALESNVAASQKIYDFIKNYKGNDLENELKKEIAAQINMLPVAEQPAANLKEQIINQQAKASASPWFQYFIKFNPDVYLSKLKIPVLAINGSKDVQVIAKENLAGWQSSLQKAGNKNFEIAELQGLNHLFQEAKTGAVAEYAEIEQTISPKALEVMTNWILKLK